MIAIVLGAMGVILAFGVLNHKKSSNSELKKSTVVTSNQPNETNSNKPIEFECKKYRQETICPMIFSPAECSAEVKVGNENKIFSAGGGNTCQATLSLKEKICDSLPMVNQNSISNLTISCKKSE
jgi:hypothetical protein